MTNHETPRTARELADTAREALGDLYGQGDVIFDGRDSLRDGGEAVEALVRVVERLHAALTDIAAKQRGRLETYRSLGIVFDGPLGTDPTNWQHIAFSTYTDLCEAESIARAALEGEGE